MSDANDVFQLPTGFQYAGVACGIKDSGKPDLALIIPNSPCVAAGVYTTNLVRAASIDWNRNITPTDSLRGVIVNSGNANACTGTTGIQNNEAMARLIGASTSGTANDVLVLSTGIIGHQLPMDNISSGVESAFQSLGSSPDRFESAANAILTTDQSTKTACRTVQGKDGRSATICGMAKGAGMIGPKMATMLAVICTDARLTPDIAQAHLTQATNGSFNRISVENHMSITELAWIDFDGVVFLAGKK